jgi:hypothetical protein
LDLQLNTGALGEYFQLEEIDRYATASGLNLWAASSEN